MQCHAWYTIRRFIQVHLVGEPEGEILSWYPTPLLQTNDISYDSLGLGVSGLEWCRIVQRCCCLGNDV